jgi:hypothetical protein
MAETSSIRQGGRRPISVYIRRGEKQREEKETQAGVGDQRRSNTPGSGCDARRGNRYYPLLIDRGAS